MSEIKSGGDFAWTGQPDEVGCNFALGHLTRNLPQRLATNGRLHAESLMAAAGAIAGMCAQVSLLSDEPALEAAKTGGGLMEATLKDGRKFYFGDALNGMLYTNDRALAPSRVWNLLVSVMLSAGVPLDELPPIEAMFAHVSKVLGSEQEGFPSTPKEHQPLMPAQQLLKVVGPLAFDCLTGEIDPVCVKNGFRADERHWAAITAQVAARMLMDAMQALHPKLGLIIAMESAIYASKIPGDERAMMKS